MGIPPRNTARVPSYVLPCVISLSLFSLSALLLYKVDDFAMQTKTLAGHNLDPTPWHIFPAKKFHEQTRHARAYKIIQCSYLTCPSTSMGSAQLQGRRRRPKSSHRAEKCPDFYRFIHHDLEPWATSRISKSHLMEAKKYAAFRVVIVGGKVFADLYYDCYQSRAMVTIWGLLQLLRRYPGMVPDVDIMFDCMDKPSINKTEHESFPLPLFRYCTNQDHFDIPFPDWSFWGWPETNIRPWNEEFQEIKQGSRSESWLKKTPLAYWKGNPDVSSPVRVKLMTCNDSNLWGARILRQNWEEEEKSGFQQSKLSNQCKYRYKIYAEGYAWSVSLKYILSCGSLTLIITPKYEDFFSRALIPKKNYWPVTPDNLCESIKSAVDWANQHPSEAKAIGHRGQDLMETLNVEKVYDYMFHLIIQYSKLLDFKPIPPSSALEVCPESLLCLADDKLRQAMKKSAASVSPTQPCTLQRPNKRIIRNWLLRNEKIMQQVQDMVPPKT